jgi:O-antigen/teichoic acid export membrane protein
MHIWLLGHLSIYAKKKNMSDSKFKRQCVEGKSIPMLADGDTQPRNDKVRFVEVRTNNLRRRTTHGAFASVSAQAAVFVLRVGSMTVLARLLAPGDFGLVNMVTAVTGFLGLFRDAGLSMATVQRDSITTTQLSTLFWVNLAFGLILAVSTALAAPILAVFYREPQLVWITMALGLTFVFNGASTQHRATLQRNLRITTLAVIDTASLALSIVIGIGMAAMREGYWSLVAMAIAQPAASMIGIWLMTRWVPGRPQRGLGVGSMLKFGGTVTLNNVVAYLAYNTDKMLIGHFFGAATLGLYGRAYQLINIPSDNLNAAMGSVAFPALSRVQNDPARLKKYFLTGYSFLLELAMPLTAVFAIFADDIILVFLGPQWHKAANIFRLLAPTVIAFGLINPFGWLLYATGRARRSLMIAFFIAPVVIFGYCLGLRHGILGVALGYSLAMLVLAGPVISWSKSGTMIHTYDILRSVSSAFLSTMSAVLLIIIARRFFGRMEPPIVRLVVECTIFSVTYLSVLLFAMNRRHIYREVLQEIGLLPKRQ